MLDMWQKGWACLFDALNELSDSDLEKIVQIRGEDHTVVEAINRQLAHYSSHLGQIIYIAKMVNNENWESLSIPRNKN
jgi:c-di-GMP-related signal transduction protein